jgi:homoserine kinase
MASRSVLVRIPASIGNFGGAKSGVAVALAATLNVKVTPRPRDGQVGIRYFGSHGERVPRDASNLVVRSLHTTLQAYGRPFFGADLEIFSSVPVGVGLGSSAAAVLAGIIAADHLSHLRLDEPAIFEIAGIYESRFDNLLAAWHGGMAAQSQSRRSFQTTSLLPGQDSTVNVVVPLVAIAEGERQRPSDRIANAVKDSWRARCLAEWLAAPRNHLATEFDAPLPPTCEKSVPGLEEVLTVRTSGQTTIFVCGSGPAVGILAKGDRSEAVAAVRAIFARHGVATTASEFRLSAAGAQQWNAVRPNVTVPPAKSLSGISPDKSTRIRV